MLRIDKQYDLAFVCSIGLNSMFSLVIDSNLTGKKFCLFLNSCFLKFATAIWLYEWLGGQNFKLLPKNVISWKVRGNIFAVCFYFDEQRIVHVIEPSLKKEQEFQKFIKNIFTYSNCRCKRRKFQVYGNLVLAALQLSSR